MKNKKLPVLNKHKILIGNWKMNKVYNEIEHFFVEFNRLYRKNKMIKMAHDTVMIAPTFIGLLPALSYAKKGMQIIAQDAHYEKNGAFTGRVSWRQLKEYNVNGAIIGHSEIRSQLAESDATINKKVLGLVNNDMLAVLCIGESLKEFNNKKTAVVLEKQITAALKDFDHNKADKLIVAYEPIWAIGTGKTATDSIIEKSINVIKRQLEKTLGKVHAHKVKVLYGGSANESNAKQILKIANVDGLLIGGASLDHEKFIKILKSTPNYRKVKASINAAKSSKSKKKAK